MEADLPEDALNRPKHFGAGLFIRNNYNLWSEKSELNKLFKKYGVDHPDDMSGLIMETYLRAKNGHPFKLDQLIKLNQGFYKSKDKKKYMKKLIKEYYIYKGLPENAE